MGGPQRISDFAKKTVHNFAFPIHGSTPFSESTNHRIDLLLRPLRRISLTDFISAFGCESNTEETVHVNASASLGSKICAVAGFSSRALGGLRGMQVHIGDLCNAWNDQYTSSFRLHRIECFREKYGAHHEYLIAKIVSEGDSIDETDGLWLRLERRPKTIEGMRDYISGFMGGFEAHDLVTIARQREHLLHREDDGPEFRASMTFSENVSLTYMLQVVSIIHEESPAYHIIGAHCWFFASVIVESLMSHGIWEQERAGWYDHWKSKNYVNREQYDAIKNRLKILRLNKNIKTKPVLSLLL